MSKRYSYAIVADIGGTNARFSRVNLDTLLVDRIQVYSCLAYSSLYHALSAYQQSHDLSSVKDVAIAIACPITNDWVSMTNFHWQFSIESLRQQLDLQQLQVINDFAATAMSLPILANEDKIKIGDGDVVPEQTMLVLGAGTGLGVAYLIPEGERFKSLSGEAGHQDWAVQTEQEWFILQFLQQRYGHVSVERILSGSGLENLYLAIAAFQKQNVQPLNASEISSLALLGRSTIATAAVQQFFAALGRFAGDLALTLNTFGGVYIAGGIIPRLLPLLKESEFRARFEEKGRFSWFNHKIATYIVTAEYPGLLGAAAYLKQNLDLIYD